MNESKDLKDLPTIPNSNTKKELAILKNIVKNIDEEEEKIYKNNISTSNETSSTNNCAKTKLQDLYLVLIAMAFFLFLGNPWTQNGLNYFINNRFLALILSLLIFGSLLYIVYIFMP